MGHTMVVSAIPNATPRPAGPTTVALCPSLHRGGLAWRGQFRKSRMELRGTGRAAMVPRMRVSAITTTVEILMENLVPGVTQLTPERNGTFVTLSNHNNLAQILRRHHQLSHPPTVGAFANPQLLYSTGLSWPPDSASTASLHQIL